MKYLGIGIFLLLIFLLFSPVIEPMLTQHKITVKELVKNKPFTKAIYVFHWGDKEKILIDDYKKVNEIRGYVQDQTDVNISNNLLTVNFKNNDPILITNQHSIDIGEKCTKAYGHMGVFTNSDSFVVKQDGYIEIVNAGLCR